MASGMWDLPGLGVEPVSPELAGGFFTTEPPGKPLEIYFRKAFSKYIYISCKFVYLTFSENMLCEDSFIQPTVIQYNVMFHTLKIKK